MTGRHDAPPASALSAQTREDAFAQLAERVEALDACSDEMNAFFAAIEQRLHDLGATVTAWLDEPLRNAAHFEGAWTIGYAKMRGAWRLVGRWDRAPSAVRPFSGVPRAVRAAALPLMGKLVAQIAKNAATLTSAAAQVAGLEG